MRTRFRANTSAPAGASDRRAFYRGNAIIVNDYLERISRKNKTLKWRYYNTASPSGGQMLARPAILSHCPGTANRHDEGLTIMLAFSMRWLISALIGLGMGFASQAQDSATPTILTPAMVENLIASYPVVKETADQLREQFDVPDDAGGAAAWRAWTAVGGAKAQLDDTVRSYGFSDFSAWVRALSTTAQAYAFIDSGEDIDRQMAEALQRIESDPNIPEAQKEMMRQQLSHSVAAIAAMKPSQASIDAVKPYAEQLSRLFKD